MTTTHPQVRAERARTISQDEQYLDAVESDSHNSRPIGRCQECGATLLAAEVRANGSAHVCADCSETTTLPSHAQI